MNFWKILLLGSTAIYVCTIEASKFDRRSNFARSMELFDLKTGQKPVLTFNTLDSLLRALPLVHYSSLPKQYIEYSNSQLYSGKLQYKEYYQIQGEDVFKFIVGHFRIGDLMSKDTFYSQNLDSLPKGISQYWLMDKNELHAFLSLILSMRKNGLDDSALSINHGHRHPQYNKQVGGVSGSYHMQGVAIDLKVGDVNRDGKADATDKQLLIDILENDIIGDNGGLGLYPGSDVIHFDTRGYKARWNKQ